MADKLSYGQFCPVAVAAQILTTRWTPLILRELLMGSTRFSDLRKGLPRISQSMLTSRLNDLNDSGIISKTEMPSGGYEYQLTSAGEKLRPIIEMMGLWGVENLRYELDDDKLDVNLLFWDIHRNVGTPIIPPTKRFVVHFNVGEVSAREAHWWIVSFKNEADLCYRDPAYDIDIDISASLKVLTTVWMGRLSLNQAIRTRQLKISGSSDNKKIFTQWFQLSCFANRTTQQRLSINQ